MKGRTSSIPVAVFMLAGGLLCAQEPSVRSVSVSGTAETKTAPDHIVWHLSLTDTDKAVLTAKTSSDSKVKSVLALREKLEIAEGDMETGHVSVSREYERDQHGRRTDFKHFVVSRGITIRQRDLKRFDEYLDALVSSAEMEVSFSFESSRIHEVRAETRLRAVKAARDKAVAMAAAAGAGIGRVLTINEHPQTGGWQSPLANNAIVVNSVPSVDVASDRFIPGAIRERVTVYATFELE